MRHSHAEGGNTHRHHHDDGHAHAHDARHIDAPAQLKEAACADDGCGACAMPAAPLQRGDPSARGRSFRIATMDCAAEAGIRPHCACAWASPSESVKKRQRQSAISAANSAFENVNKAARQVADITEAGVSAATGRLPSRAATAR